MAYCHLIVDMAAKSFYDGEMYRQARAKRAGTISYLNMVLVEGLDAPV